MASPQLEDGYTKIANELIDALCTTNLPAGERQVFDVIMRLTYGFNKKADEIAFSQFAEKTMLSRRTIIYALQNLEAKKIIIVERHRLSDVLNVPNKYRINKNYEEWGVQNFAPSVKKNRDRAVESYRGSAKGSTPSAKVGKRVVQKSVENEHTFAPTKDKKQLTKDKYSDEGSSRVKFNDLGKEIVKAFESVDPKNKTYYGNTTQRAACDFLIQEYGLDEVLKRIAVLPRTNKMPYFPNITTPAQLKDKWISLQDAVERLRNESKIKSPVAFI